MITFGNAKIKAVYYGGTKIKAAYYGSQKVFSSTRQVSISNFSGYSTLWDRSKTSGDSTLVQSWDKGSSRTTGSDYEWVIFTVPVVTQTGSVAQDNPGAGGVLTINPGGTIPAGKKIRINRTSYSDVTYVFTPA